MCVKKALNTEVQLIQPGRLRVRLWNRQGRRVMQIVSSVRMSGRSPSSNEDGQGPGMGPNETGRRGCWSQSALRLGLVFNLTWWGVDFEKSAFDWINFTTAMPLKHFSGIAMCIIKSSKHSYCRNNFTNTNSNNRFYSLTISISKSPQHGGQWSW